ncbi:MAG: hypothetical protein EON54_02880 [Alcaligenaceae bacterium]|nr:MAG: hypothetical protein EON54_02880 [Alcaligenaceae bacterium]
MLDPNSPNYLLQSLINGEKALQQTIATGYAQDRTHVAEKQSQETGENLNLAHNHIAHLKKELDEAVDINRNLFKEGMEYKNQTQYYKSLLAKPMVEIAEENHDFKAAYEAQMELLADWMVSQKAFKELAIQFGIEKGLTSDEVKKMGQNKKLDVLNDLHDPSHKTNAVDLVSMQEEVERLKIKTKLKSQK